MTGRAGSPSPRSVGRATALIGVGSDHGESLVEAAFLQSIDGLIAGRFGGEDLREEQAQGNPRLVDPIPPPMVEVTASGLDDGDGEEVEEGESVLLVELIAEGKEWSWAGEAVD